MQTARNTSGYADEPRRKPPKTPRLRFEARPRQSKWNDPLRRRMLSLADLLSAVFAVALATAAGVDGISEIACAALVAPVWLVVAKAHGLYDLDHARIQHLTVDELPKLLHTATLSAGLIALLFALLPGVALGPIAAVLLWVCLLGAGFTFRAASRWLWRRIVPPERGLLLGGGAIARDLERKLLLEHGHHLVVARSMPVAEAEDRLRGMLESEEIDRVIVVDQQLDEQSLYPVIALCRSLDVKLSVAPPLQAMLGTAVSLTHLAELPVIEFRTWDPSRSTMFFKRTIDVVASSFALVIVSPLMCLTAVAIRLDSRGPALFFQLRAGQLGRPFRMIKFRTMVVDAEERLPDLVRLDELREPVYKVRNDPRITRIGKLLRRTSVDELPQLFNVLRGDMSLVGPRPEDVRLVARYSEAELFRLEMRPGITGPMQVHGRGELSFRERLAIEREYIENYTLAKDLSVLLRTAAAVVRGVGAF